MSGDPAGSVLIYLGKVVADGNVLAYKDGNLEFDLTQQFFVSTASIITNFTLAPPSVTPPVTMAPVTTALVTVAGHHRVYSCFWYDRSNARRANI
jgi:hypothetical protein